MLFVISFRSTSYNLRFCFKLAILHVIFYWFPQVNWKTGQALGQRIQISTEDLPRRSTTKTYAESQPSYTPPSRNIASAKTLNPLTPATFCKKCIFWTFWCFLSWISAKLALIQSKMRLQHNSLPSLPPASHFTPL